MIFKVFPNLNDSVVLWICDMMRLTWLKPTHSLLSRCAAGSQVTSEAPFLVHNQLTINNNKKGIIRPEVSPICIAVAGPVTGSTPLFFPLLLQIDLPSFWQAMSTLILCLTLFRGFAVGMDHGLLLIQGLIDGGQHTISCSRGLLIHMLVAGSLSLAGKCGLQVPELARIKLSGYHWRWNAFSKPPSPVICFRVFF